jgi:hypothetical protein
MKQKPSDKKLYICFMIIGLSFCFMYHCLFIFKPLDQMWVIFGTGFILSLYIVFYYYEFFKKKKTKVENMSIDINFRRDNIASRNR